MKFDQDNVTGSAAMSPGDLHDFNAIAQWRGSHQADKSAFVFLADGEAETDPLTFGTLHRSACSVANWIQEHGLVGERVLLLYPHGTDFIIGFLGCLYAGAIAVPAYPPHPRRSDSRLEAILADCQPKAAFCIQKEVENLSLQFADHNLLILATDTLSPSTGTWESQSVGHDSVAYIQYTSGSTGNPKGVMVTQGNLLHQIEYLANLSGHDENMVLVSWQPFFHDMGLVGTVVTTIYTGAICYAMAPAAFLRKPIRWLQAISRYRGTSATGPNFAFELCVTQTTAEQREGLDLSSWKTAWNGAEPIRADTLDRFSEVYEPYGFDRRTHFPCFGMAETTLCATAGRPDDMPVILGFQREELEQNHAVPCAAEDPLAVELVSSGNWSDGMEIVIVEAETLEQRPDGHVGEIWVAGQSVAHGYWQRPQETDETFNAYIADSNRGPYLRTGDLGFVRDDELFVTGRLKDMIIIRGRNLYPQDVEMVAQQSHDALQSEACAAFSIQVDGHEEIALALEVKRTERRRGDFGDIFAAVRSAVVENYGVAVHWIGLIQPGRISKTSSGKIMRRACRREFDSGDLALLAEWTTSEKEDDEDSSVVAAPTPDQDLVQRLLSLPPVLRHQTLVTHLQSEIARLVEMQSLPDPQKGFERLGIDSMGAVKLVDRLQDQLGDSVDLPTTLLFDQPNIEAVARYLVQTLFGHAEEVADTATVVPVINEPVAIVGLACRFPDAADADEFWQVLDQGKDTIREIPEERWDVDTYFDEDAGVPGKMNSRYGGFINGIDGFDAAFFDISPREATSMDPQHRHLLEVSWLALEDAGIAPETLNGRPVGVFVGISTSDYDQVLSARGMEGTDAFSATGNAHSAAAGRLSFLLGLQGPCVAVDTACSSSLVAVHQAIQNLRLGECEAAIAGGVNMILRPDITVAFSRARLLAPDGRCKTFDAAADGYVRSEGCGMVVLKRLHDAERDGDQILAVIRGSAVNQDGRSSGLTSPNGPSQTQVIKNALANGGVSPADVDYLECHGTGTVLGDPIEVQAANAALSKGRDTSNPVMIGSVKTNLGHLEAAAGIAGLIKVVLALRHGRIPRNLHFETPNQHIPWDSLAVKVAANAIPWIADSRQRIAGVSSFGFTGTNAHLVVEGASQVESKETMVATESGPCLLSVSARTEEALSALAGLYADWMQTHDDLPLDDICHTANTGRNHFEHRAVLLCTSREGAHEQLAALARGKRKSETALGMAPREGRRRVAFLFPGEGLQYSGMASDLYENEPVFRECLDRCARVYDEHARENGSPMLRELMFHPEGMESSQQTSHIRAALYSLQVSLAALWRSWGVLPDALMGHSAGEYAAACVAGVFSIEQGLRLVMERARLLESLPAGGAMMSVTAPADAVDAALEGDDSVSVSAYNGLNTVVSGPVERLDALIERFEKEERYCTRLPATNAAHCLYVEPILEDFEAFASGIEYSAPGTPLVSGLFGAVIEPGSIPDATYWRNQTRNPVRFAQGIQALFETTSCDVVLELGPQAELIWLAQMSHRPDHKVLWASSLEKGHNALEYMLSTAAKLHANGTDLDFSGIENADNRYRRLTLPTYPFQHKSYWAGPMGGIMRSELQECLYRVNWEESDAQASKSAESSPQRWLILADDEELCACITAELETFGQQVVTCPAEDSGSVLPGHFDAFLGEAGTVDCVLLLTGPAVDVEASTDAIWQAQNFGVHRALLVAQALISAKSSARLWLLTRGVQSVSEGETIDPTHAPVWGFGRTFAVEHPERFGGLVDLPLEGDARSSVDGLAKSLLCEDGENQLALRAGRRCVARLRSHPLPDKVSVNPEADGSYLITGGTGALGLHLARHLVDRGAKQIILTSRSGASESSREVTDELEKSGCHVEIIQADLSQDSEVECLLDQIDDLEGGHPLRGIVHAAGVLEGAPTVNQTPELYSTVMAPKLSGAWNLHRQTVARNMSLDFFVLFSSGASLLGFPWQGNYAAANAFLDSLALHRRSLGLPAVSINWGPWEGEGVANRLQALGWEELGTRLIPPKIAIRLFDYLGNTPSASVCVHPMDWSKWNEQARTGVLAPALQNLLDGMLSPEQLDDSEIGTAVSAGSSGEAGPLVRRLAKLDPAKRHLALVAHLQEQVGAVLGVPPEQVARDTGFFELGMNSIMAVELRGALQAQMGGALEIQAVAIFNHPTVRRISEYLIDLLFFGR